MADAGGARFIKDEKKIVTSRKLKGNEVSTIVIIAIVAVAALGAYFILFPMFTKMGALSTEIENLKTKETEIKAQIAQTEIFHEQYEQAKTDYNVYFSYFHSPMDPEIVDERVTSMLIAHDMTPATLSMTTLNVESVAPYFAYELRVNPLPDAQGAVADAETEAPPAEEAEADEPGEYDHIYNLQEDAAQAVQDASYAFVYTVNVSAYGDRANLYTFLAQVANMTAMHVISFDFTDPVTTKDSDGKATTTPGRINMEIKMYVLIDGVPAIDFGGGGR